MNNAYTETINNCEFNYQYIDPNNVHAGLKITRIKPDSTIKEIKIPDKLSAGVNGVVNVTTIAENATSFNNGSHNIFDNIETIEFPETINRLEKNSIAHCNSLKTLKFLNKDVNFSLYPNASILYDNNCPDKIQMLAPLNSKTDISLRTNIIKFNTTDPTKIPKILYGYSNNLNVQVHSNFSYAKDETTIHPDPNKENIELLKYLGNDKNVIVPRKIDESHPITTLNQFLFENNDTIETITIPEGIKELKAYTIFRCSNIKEIEIKDNDCVLNDNFIKNFNSQKVKIKAPTGSKAEDFVRNRNSQFEFESLGVQNTPPSSQDYDIEVNNGTIRIKNYRGTAANLTIPDKINGMEVKEIDKETFNHVRQSIKEITINCQIETIEDETFKDCTSLEKIVLPSSLKKIGKDAFNNCQKLKEIVIPDNIITIENNAFANCTGISLISGSPIVANYAQTNNLNYQNPNQPTAEWQEFEGITQSLYKITLEEDITKVKAELKKLENSSSISEEKTRLKDILDELDKDASKTKEIIVSFTIGESDKIYKIQISNDCFVNIKDKLTSISHINISNEFTAIPKKYEEGKSIKEYEKYLYEFNKAIKDEAYAKNELTVNGILQSPIAKQRKKYRFEDPNIDPYYDNIYVERYIKALTNPKKKSPFGKTAKRIKKKSSITDSENKTLFQKIKQKFKNFDNFFISSDHNKNIIRGIAIIAMIAVVLLLAPKILPFVARPFMDTFVRFPSLFLTGQIKDPLVAKFAGQALFYLASLTGVIAILIHNHRKNKKAKADPKQPNNPQTPSPTTPPATPSQPNPANPSNPSIPLDTLKDILKQIKISLEDFQNAKADYDNSVTLNEEPARQQQCKQTYETTQNILIDKLLDCYEQYPLTATQSEVEFTI